MADQDRKEPQNGHSPAENEEEKKEVNGNPPELSGFMMKKPPPFSSPQGFFPPPKMGNGLPVVPPSFQASAFQDHSKPALPAQSQLPLQSDMFPPAASDPVKYFIPSSPPQNPIKPDSPILKFGISPARSPEAPKASFTQSSVEAKPVFGSFNQMGLPQQDAKSSPWVSAKPLRMEETKLEPRRTGLEAKPMSAALSSDTRDPLGPGSILEKLRVKANITPNGQEWKCPMCTLENSFEFYQCDVCLYKNESLQTLLKLLEVPGKLREKSMLEKGTEKISGVFTKLWKW